MQFATLLTSLLGLSAIAAACKGNHCCRREDCSGEILTDCDAKCCSTVKKGYWKDNVWGWYYFGVACAT